MLDLARAVLEASGSSSPIVHVELPEDDPKVRRPDLTRTRRHLGWEPQVRLQEGLARTVRWMRETGLATAAQADQRAEKLPPSPIT
jgi:nucleoside-diphosphate-sugar epimerase